jgi:F-type H+-transporting ATPase subunit alpha
VSKVERILRTALDAVERGGRALRFAPRVEHRGVVRSVADGVALVEGLHDVENEELVRFDSGATGLVMDLLEDSVGVVILSDPGTVGAGSRAVRTGRSLSVPVGEALVGRVVDPLGTPLDDGGPVAAEALLPVERTAPGVLEREPVTVPLHTGVKVIDAMIPVGRGQRELIVGDRSIGKTTLAVDTILNQKGAGVTCVYVAVGQKASSTGRVVEALRKGGAMAYTVVVASDAEAPPGLKYIAPYAGCSVAEHFRDRGGDALIVYDDLTRHADAYREISLLLRRPPGREAYPGDIFYIHSRLLERAARLDAERGGGSLTALPVVETQAGNISAFVPTNLISITDGQIYLDAKLFQGGQLPAVDTGRSVSRVGGKTQLPAVKSVAGRLRLDYNQYLELEYFTRFGARVDASTRRVLERGKRLRRVLRQPPLSPVPIAEQVAVLFASTEGAVDDLDLDRVALFEDRLRTRFREEMAELAGRMVAGGQLLGADRKALTARALEVREALGGPQSSGGETPS